MAPIKRKSGWDILQPNLLSEGVRLGLDMKIATYRAYKFVVRVVLIWRR